MAMRRGDGGGDCSSRDSLVFKNTKSATHLLNIITG